MNPQKLIAAGIIALGGVTTVVAVKDFIQITKTERQKRDAIRLETEKQIAAIHRASSIVHQKIRNGDYDSNIFQAIPTILSDQRFFEMTERLED